MERTLGGNQTEEKKYGADINGGVLAEEAQAFVKAELGIALPEEYLTVLRTVNGIEYDTVTVPAIILAVLLLLSA